MSVIQSPYQRLPGNDGSRVKFEQFIKFLSKQFSPDFSGTLVISISKLVVFKKFRPFWSYFTVFFNSRKEDRKWPSKSKNGLRNLRNRWISEESSLSLRSTMSRVLVISRELVPVLVILIYLQCRVRRDGEQSQILGQNFAKKKKK